ncbi:hypothetical protein AVEN_43941-1 [Araneus ventricosus]|uniref:Uncharacterized protein n=1 Tax=Araneus ventricosus TaxID=182803 RepID=A0A4Y2LRS2_ARAVE|nr:hypothetical protein AVEN_43941-1 [Araneus ventricosus]
MIAFVAESPKTSFFKSNKLWDDLCNLTLYIEKVLQSPKNPIELNLYVLELPEYEKKKLFWNQACSPVERIIEKRNNLDGWNSGHDLYIKTVELYDTLRIRATLSVFGKSVCLSMHVNMSMKTQKCAKLD